MSRRITPESETNDLYKEAEQIKREVAQLSVDKFEIEGQLRRLGERMDRIDNTLGMLKPGGRGAF